MKFACSMYWGGDIVFAADCDYQTYKDLGTTCPYCSSAVHIRAASSRKINGKEILFNAYFAHYKTGGGDDWCEARSDSMEGKAEIEQRRIQAKGQRLKVFNDRLWDLHAKDRNISSQRIKALRSAIGQGNINRMLPQVRNHIKSNRDRLAQEMVDLQKMIRSKNEESGIVELMASTLRPDLDTKAEALAELEKQKKYFTQANQKLHQEICLEILDFLSTRSGGYALEKYTIFALNVIGSVGQLQRPSELFSLPDLLDFTCCVICNNIYGTHWGDVLQYSTNAQK